MDPPLQTATANDPGLQPVIVTFQGVGAPSAASQTLRSLGILNGRTLRQLPIAGVLTIPAQIAQLVAGPNVVSVYLNHSLTLDNDGATALTGVQHMHLNPTFTRRNDGLPMSGKGIGLVVNDSGIDGTHPDLKQNVPGTSNPNAQNGMLHEAAQHLGGPNRRGLIQHVVDGLQLGRQVGFAQ